MKASNYIKFNLPSLGSAITILISFTIHSSCQVGRFIWYNFADVNDHKIFDARPLQAKENQKATQIGKRFLAPWLIPINGGFLNQKQF